MTHLPVKAHASLGASSAHRWMACPGSVALEAPLPNRDSEHSRAGTAAHALMEMSLKRNLDPSVWLDTTVEGVQVDQEMVDAVTVLTEYVHGLQAEMPDGKLWIERRFSLSDLAPPAPMFGTSDVVFLGGRTLHVIDLKYGTGHVVDVEGNPQLRYYGLGAALSIANEHPDQPVPFDVVQLTIIQPRAYHPDGLIRHSRILYSELVEWTGDLLAAADRALAPDAPLVSGPHCRFCKATAICPARKEEAQALAQVEFSAPALPNPPAPSSLSIEQVVEILDKIDLVEDWIKGLRQHAQDLLERGQEVPGYKLVPKRAVRKWENESDVRSWLEESGWSPEEFEERKLKSPAQLEKLVGKKNIPEGMVVKQSSGFTMAPASDPRPALPAGPDVDFATPALEGAEA